MRKRNDYLITACIYCGKILKRAIWVKRPSCFDCKIKLHSKWHKLNDKKTKNKKK